MTIPPDKDRSRRPTSSVTDVTLQTESPTLERFEKYEPSDHYDFRDGPCR